ncbi:SCO2525 family SAM-dependent methyltransferase [Kineosporia succinea]|uniref:NNMT/PNMT/TEMT family protein n=1 Tax=Kineosporia succinea TaxID=84632 RepID=A0ABT9PDJ5_9ACTN|nr:SCO2525 family SAM-dependent methyltransferase [Kineosporia succinea]MDP9830788.1 hypothetical protein [Kineosporia succinea]
MAWKDFEPSAYWHHNYASLREDDRAILEHVGGFFSEYHREHPRVAGGPRVTGIDVGSGSNLYPALAMLPWADEILLTDHSPSNVAWLRGALAGQQPDTDADGAWVWLPFWETLRAYDGYDAATDPRRELTRRCSVEQRDVFQLQADGRFGIGTMFFVAESLTSYENEFEEATEHFLRSLAPGAPFAAAFMDKSLGYVVGDKSFPAVREVDSLRVDVTLRQFGAKARVTKIPVPGNDPLRDGYDGMIIAVGTTA